MNLEYDSYSCENFASIFEENHIKYEFGINSSVLNQEPVSRDWQAITNVCDTGNEEGTVMHEQALPSIYTLQPCNPREVSTFFISYGPYDMVTIIWSLLSLTEKIGRLFVK